MMKSRSSMRKAQNALTLKQAVTSRSKWTQQLITCFEMTTESLRLGYQLRFLRIMKLRYFKYFLLPQ